MVVTFCSLLLLPVFSYATPIQKGCEIDGNVSDCLVKQNLTELPESARGPEIKTKAEKKVIEEWLTDVYDHNHRKQKIDRTWRINRKALAPILIGLGVKALALIPIALSALVVMGTVAIFTGKVSLAISAFMFLKRFFSSDHHSGGFAGLNPLGYPHATHAPQDHLHGKQGNRKTLYVVRGRSRADQILKQLENYEARTRLDGEQLLQLQPSNDTTLENPSNAIH